MALPVSNARLVEAFGHRRELAAYADELRRRIAEDGRRLAVAEAALTVTEVHRGIAIECRTSAEGDVLIRAPGDDIWVAGRRALIAAEEGGWFARLHYRPNVKRGGLPRDPGPFSFAIRASAENAGKDWACLGIVPGEAADLLDWP